MGEGEGAAARLEEDALLRSAMPTARCPACGREVPTDPRFVTWCDGCDWNLDPAAPAAPQGRRAVRRTDRARAREAATFAAVRTDGFGADRRLRAIALLATAPVHLLALVLLGLAVRLAVSDVAWLVRWALVALLVAVLGQTRPRLGSVPQGRLVLEPTAAPATFEVLRVLSAAVGTRAPDLVAVDGRYRADLRRVGLRRRRVLVVGLPLWNALDGPARVALLAHQIGHDASRDVRRTLVFTAALDALDEWSALLRPGAELTRRRVNHPYATRAGGVALVEMLVSALLSPLSVTVGAMGAALRRLVEPGGQVAEYRADAVAVAIAGRHATEAWLRRSLLGARGVEAVRAAMVRREPDVWAASRRSTDEVPEREIDRWERISDRSGGASEPGHPNTHFRLELVRRPPPGVEPARSGAPAPVVVPAAAWATVDRELAPAACAVLDDLRR